MKLNITFSVDDICSEPEHMINLEKLVALINEYRIKPTLFTIPNYQGKYSILDFKPNNAEILLKNSEIACHGLTHTDNEGNDSDEMKGVSPEEFENRIGIGIDLIKERFGKKPNGYKAPGYQVDDGHLEIIKKHFKWIQIDQPEACVWRDGDFCIFPLTYDFCDIGTYLPDTIFLTSHITNHHNKNVIDMKNYLIFRGKVKKMKENFVKTNYLTLSEMREEVLSSK